MIIFYTVENPSVVSVTCRDGIGKQSGPQSSVIQCLLSPYEKLLITAMSRREFPPCKQITCGSGTNSSSAVFEEKQVFRS
jgi:hypothetical protein